MKISLILDSFVDYITPQGGEGMISSTMTLALCGESKQVEPGGVRTEFS